jgi:hypothetical protein
VDINTVTKLAQEITNQSWLDNGMTQDQIDCEKAQHAIVSKIIDQHIRLGENFEYLLEPMNEKLTLSTKF